MIDSDSLATSNDGVMKRDNSINIGIEKKEEYGPWLLMEWRQPRHKNTVTINSPEKMETGQKSKDASEHASPTHKLGPQTQVADMMATSTQPNGQVVNAINEEPSQKKMLTITNTKPISNTQRRPDPKLGKWVMKERPDHPKSFTQKAQKEPKLKQITSIEPKPIYSSCAEIILETTITAQPNTSDSIITPST
ncbi:hypothetical protein SLE2022_106970 [Rubroshorea leprosula]